MEQQSEKFSQGQDVLVQIGRNYVEGKIEREITGTEDVEEMGRKARGSSENPEYLIRLDSGKFALRHGYALQSEGGGGKQQGGQQQGGQQGGKKQRGREASEFQKGDKVAFQVVGNRVEGVVEEVLTEDRSFGQKTIHASNEDPQYLVKHEKTGKVSHHHSSKLEKIGE